MKIYFLDQDAFNPENEESTVSQTLNLDTNGSDPNSTDYLKIEISDALNEKDKVKFTVKTKVSRQRINKTGINYQI